MTESERINLLIKCLAGGNAAEFARAIGTSTPVVSLMRKGSVGIRLQVDKICKAYPCVDRSWLETGEGYPGDISVEYVKAHYSAQIRRCEMIIDHLCRRINELEAILSNKPMP